MKVNTIDEVTEVVVVEPKKFVVELTEDEASKILCLTANLNYKESFGLYYALLDAGVKDVYRAVDRNSIDIPTINFIK